MTIMVKPAFLKYSLTLWVILALSFPLLAQSDKDFPAKPIPPRLVNDLAGMMSADEQAQLEQKLVDFDKTTSTQITIVTIRNLGGYEVAQYAVELGNRWGVGRKGKDNGVLVLASLDDRDVNISTGYGLEGALTDATSGRIIRNEIVPEFKKGNYYQGFNKAADAIIAATKGEYTNDEKDKDEGKRGFPLGLIIFIVIILWLFSRGGGRGGGGYMSRRGYRSWGGPVIFGGFGGGSSSWGGGGSGGGFGGFGGGSFGGGGASGSW
ncbi:MAG: YgcG family protein [Flavipsychrobacter sp.]|jgi:uncharacterized protein|nr:YgcG family protein [Flavipsychrobacter sp.]